MITSIKTADLRKMNGQEGLILQGCGGNPQEWIDGINGLLTEENILLDSTKFTDVSVFENEGLTNILFPFSDNVCMDAGKLAVWRLATNDTYGGTWLSDYVENKLGGFEKNLTEKLKPDCELIGTDGNVFSLIGKASQTLKHCGMHSEAKEMCDRIMNSGSYEEALGIIGEYVNITGPADKFDGDYDDDEGMVMSL